MMIKIIKIFYISILIYGIGCIVQELAINISEIKNSIASYFIDDCKVDDNRIERVVTTESGKYNLNGNNKEQIKSELKAHVIKINTLINKIIFKYKIPLENVLYLNDECMIDKAYNKRKIVEEIQQTFVEKVNLDGYKSLPNCIYDEFLNPQVESILTIYNNRLGILVEIYKRLIGIFMNKLSIGLNYENSHHIILQHYMKKMFKSQHIDQHIKISINNKIFNCRYDRRLDLNMYNITNELSIKVIQEIKTIYYQSGCKLLDTSKTNRINIVKKFIKTDKCYDCFIDLIDHINDQITLNFNQSNDYDINYDVFDKYITNTCQIYIPQSKKTIDDIEELIVIEYHNPLINIKQIQYICKIRSFISDIKNTDFSINPGFNLYNKICIKIINKLIKCNLDQIKSKESYDKLIDILRKSYKTEFKQRNFELELFINKTTIQQIISKILDLNYTTLDDIILDKLSKVVTNYKCHETNYNIDQIMQIINKYINHNCIILKININNDIIMTIKYILNVEIKNIDKVWDIYCDIQTKLKDYISTYDMNFELPPDLLIILEIYYDIYMESAQIK